jgi:hypothetical protein
MAKKKGVRRFGAQGNRPTRPAAALMPPRRRLQVYAVDPALDKALETTVISRCVLPIRWEPLYPGPVGEYVEVVDIDPASRCQYEPVDLDEPHLLATDGLSPSEGNPQFHQQMAYAVAMKTIENFERALGRRIIWAERARNEMGRYLPGKDRYVRRLRIYPHALREANAYYSPNKKALLLGYFNAPTTDPRDELPGGMVFSCLSHDIIAHETTHAILDGVHPGLLSPTNEDMLAFHEAFADIAAIFQHFTIPGLVLDQIQRTRGDLALGSLLATLAVQFGRATRQGGALRNALGTFDAHGRRSPPDPAALGRTLEPHARGAILVAAVFDAFLRIYEDRVRDLRRIATGGTGILPQGEIHPDLSRRFADEAVKASQHVLTIALRALDYLPPVDITYGDYIRALITADAELVRDDTRRYRVAFVEAFRDHGIYPMDVRALGEDSLRWRPIDNEWAAPLAALMPPPEVIRTMVASWEFSHVPNLTPEGVEQMVQRMDKLTARDDLEGLRNEFLRAYWQPAAGQHAPKPAGRSDLRDALARIRRNIFDTEQQFKAFLYSWLVVATWTGNEVQSKAAQSMLGLDFPAFAGYLERKEEGINLDADGRISVDAVRPTLRAQPDGRTKVELLVILTQRIKCYLPNSPRAADRLRKPLDPTDRGDPAKAVKSPGDKPIYYHFRGGSTLLIDPETGMIRYAIGKRISSLSRRARNEEFLRYRLDDLGGAAFDRFRLRWTGKRAALGRSAELLALLHESTDEGVW